MFVLISYKKTSEKTDIVSKGRDRVERKRMRKRNGRERGREEKEP